MKWYKESREDNLDVNAKALMYLERAVTWLKGDKVIPLEEEIDFDAIQVAIEAIENQGR